MGAQKIDANWLETYQMIIALFQIDDKDKKFYSFKKTLLLSNISIDIVMRMYFLTLSNVDVNFNN